jgi:hypothetical protein
MVRVQVWVELTDDEFQAFEREAERECRPVESLIEQTVHALWAEMEHEQAEGTDHPIIP